MNKSRIMFCVNQVIDQHLRKDETQPPTVVNPRSRLIEDLQVDSIDMVVIMMELEDKFNIKIPDGDHEKMKRVKDIAKYIKSRLR